MWIRLRGSVNLKGWGVCWGGGVVSTGGVKNFLRILTSGELGVILLEVTVFCMA